MKRLGPAQDFAGAQLQNWRFHILAGAPSSPASGQSYYNSSTNVTYVWNGSAWRPTDASALTDQSIKIAALEVDPRARSTHTGQQAVSTLSDFDTAVRAYRLDQFAVPAANVAFNGYRLTGVADPVNPTDGGNKQYIDNAVQSAAAGIDSKPSVRTVSTTNITLSGLQTIDGVTQVAGDSHLAAGQTTGSQNGAYIVGSGAWTRRVTEDQTGEITPGAFWFVEEGTTYGKTQWRCNNTGTITIGTTAITIVQFGAANSYTADPSGGLQLNGNAFAVLLPTASGLQTTASGTSIKLGTNSGLQLLSGGLSILLPTGSGLIQDATGLHTDRTSTIRTPVIASGSITGDGSTATFTCNHGLGTRTIVPAFQDSSYTGVDVDWDANATGTMRMFFGTPPANGTVYYWTAVGY